METNRDTAAFNKTTSAIIGKLMNIGGIIQKESNRLLSPHNLNHQQFSILFDIFANGKVQQKNLVNRLMLERAHVSKTVSKLLEMELIELSEHAEDQRASIISVTTKGVRLIEKCRKLFEEWRRINFANLSETELIQTLDIVAKLQANLLNHAKED